MKNIYLYVLSCIMTIIFINIFHDLARHFGLVDIPSGRKNHVGEVPLTGGLAMFLAISCAMFLHGTLAGIYFAMFPALAFLVIIGVCDDLLELSAGSRFAAQAVAALWMVYMGGVAITDLGDIFGTGVVRLGVWSVPFTVFCVIGVVNAVNMLDGIDGLACGVVLGVLGVFGGVALMGGDGSPAVLLFVTVGSVVGFAVFNMRSPWRARAAVFMGDSGSMMLGFLVAWFAVELAQGPAIAFSPITAVWIMALPILDTVSLMLRRILKGRSPFAPDHDHLHHIFLQAGFSVQQTVALIMLFSLAFGVLGIEAWFYGVPEYVMFCGFMLLFLLYYFGTSNAWRLIQSR